MRTKITTSGVALATLALFAPAAPASAEPADGPGPGRIVFGAETDRGTQIWTVWPNGTHLRQITDVDGEAVNPDWSPDGRSITFELGTSDTAEVGVMDADGSHLRTLPTTGCEFEGQPVFSADGQRIIYRSEEHTSELQSPC